VYTAISLSPKCSKFNMGFNVRRRF